MIQIIYSLLRHVLWPRIWSILVDVFYRLQNHAATLDCCWTEGSVNVNEVSFVDSVAIIYILTDFLSICFSWLLKTRGIDIFT